MKKSLDVRSVKYHNKNRSKELKQKLINNIKKGGNLRKKVERKNLKKLGEKQ